MISLLKRFLDKIRCKLVPLVWTVSKETVSVEIISQTLIVKITDILDIASPLEQ